MLEACAAAPRVKRVVVTSSFGAITDEPDPTRDLTEADWNTRSSLTRNPYYFSKVQAERAAWDFMAREKPAFELVVINPTGVFGPSMSPEINTSNQIIVDLVKGRLPMIMSISFGIADVRDVAKAHLAAMTSERAKGRYICGGEALTMRQIVAVLRQAGCRGRLPRLGMDNAIGDRIAYLASYTQPRGVGTLMRTHLGRGFRYDNAKIRTDLGLSFRPARATLADTVADLTRWHHIAQPVPAATAPAH
jgi:dihydroflavonol-4-reductase